MKKLLILLTVFFAQVSYATVGFSHGNDLEAQLIQGDISVQCTGGGPGSGPTSAYYTCRRDILNPNERDYFTGPQGVVADYVILTATHEDGSTRTKDDDYIATKARSESTFNLWLASLLQRPLLDGGKNLIKYTLKNKGKVVDEGTFVAMVNNGGTKICKRRGFYHSGNTNDCSFPDHLCDRYFNENNYCQ